jgi:hypothetical protein
MVTRKFKLTFTEPLLGTVPKDPKIYASYIASKAADVQAAANDELPSVPTAEESGWTGFHTMPNGTVVLMDYTLKGFFKDACSMLSRVNGTKSKALKAFKKVIDGLIFPMPRRIIINLAGPLETCERPLRAQTAQGERVALARSDAAPIGSTVEFELKVLGGVQDGLIEEWLDYGAVRGLGQWRNGSYGRFTWEEEL